MENAEVAANWINIDTSTDWQALQKFEKIPYKPVTPHFKSLEIKLRDMVLLEEKKRRLKLLQLWRSLDEAEE